MAKFQNLTELKDFLERLEQLMDIKTYKDVLFICKDGQLSGNRLLLSIYSSALTKLFKENPGVSMSANNYNDLSSGITLTDVCCNDLQNLLNVIHSSKSIDMSSDAIPNLNYVAKQLQIKLIATKLANGYFRVRPIVKRHLDPAQQQALQQQQQQYSSSGQQSSMACLKSGTNMSPNSSMSSSPNSQSRAENGANQQQQEEFIFFENAPPNDINQLALAMSGAAASSLGQLGQAGPPPMGANNPGSALHLNNGAGAGGATSTTGLKLQEMYAQRSYFDLSHQEDCRFKCKICPKKYKFPKDLRSHFKIEHLGIMYTCNLCHAVKYRWPQDVCKHLNIKHNIKDNFMSFYSMVQGPNSEDNHHNVHHANAHHTNLNLPGSLHQQSTSESLLNSRGMLTSFADIPALSNALEVVVKESNKAHHHQQPHQLGGVKLTQEELKEMYKTNTFFDCPEEYERNRFQCKLCLKRYRWPQDVGKHLKKKHDKVGDLKAYYTMVQADSIRDEKHAIPNFSQSNGFLCQTPMLTS